VSGGVTDVSILAPPAPFGSHRVGQEALVSLGAPWNLEASLNGRRLSLPQTVASLLMNLDGWLAPFVGVVSTALQEKSSLTPLERPIWSFASPASTTCRAQQPRKNTSPKAMISPI
jgi:hypothetical protein